MSKTSVKSPLIRKLEILVRLSGEELSWLNRLEATTRRVPAGTELAVQGETFGPVVVVRRGWAMRFKTLSDGRRQITNYAIPGDIIGLYANLLEVADHSAVTLTEAEIAEFPPEAVTDLFRHHPKLAIAFAWSGAREEAVLAEKAASLGRRTAQERLAHLLLELLRRLQMVQMAQDDRFVFPVTQEQIADTLGLSTVHVNRTLGRLRADGLIEIDGPVIHVRRMPELSATADFDDLYLYVRRMPKGVQSRLSS
ncbi:Crp/Fnr family transcriptional regulator [Azospirillum halopraeferens]|uniref:Crp/Fnr family transcriptional regulator n=1 Tax=Azospirillum halopraeferens TaxID=34010 RepID=UPI0003F7E3C6|nr:Crp/Fnr family transcriptional regulator [Azospirillum halopraeferens]